MTENLEDDEPIDRIHIAMSNKMLCAVTSKGDTDSAILYHKLWCCHFNPNLLIKSL